MIDLKQKFGARVRELRKRKGWTQDYLAEIINVDSRSLRKIELGESFPSVNTLEKLTKFLEVELSELFAFEHLQPGVNLRSSIIDMMDSNPDRIPDIYKIVKALTK